MASAAHLEECDFTGSTTLVAAGSDAANSPSAEASYYFPCASAGATYHLACSVSDHCARGQKVSVHVSATEHAIDPADGAALLHSDSLARVMSLLGHRTDAATGFTYLDRGYGSEAAANVSLEMIWCAEGHA